MHFSQTHIFQNSYGFAVPNIGIDYRLHIVGYVKNILDYTAFSLDYTVYNPDECPIQPEYLI